MDIFDTTYYKINKNLHRCLGFWPYQNRKEKYILRFIIVVLNISLMIPEVYNMTLKIQKIYSIGNLFLSFSLMTNKRILNIYSLVLLA